MRPVFPLRSQRAFTLIELLVVVLIIAILIAVAAPAFLGQQRKAHDSNAKQRLSILYRSAKADSVNQQPQGDWRTPANDLAARLAADEPTIDVVEGLPEAGEVGVLPTSTARRLRLAALSKSGTMFGLTAPANGTQTLQKLAFDDFSDTGLPGWDNEAAGYTVSGGQLNANNTGEPAVRESAEPASDWTVGTQFHIGSSNSAVVSAVVLKHVEPGLFLTAEVSTTRCRLSVYIEGDRSDVASTACVPAINSTYQLTGAVEGNDVSMTYLPASGPAVNLSATLQNGDDLALGQGRSGRPGLIVKGPAGMWAKNFDAAVDLR